MVRGMFGGWIHRLDKVLFLGTNVLDFVPPQQPPIEMFFRGSAVQLRVSDSQTSFG